MKLLAIVSVLFLIFTAIKKSDVKSETTLTKEDLGKLLFSEKALSLDSSISCASCHIPQFAFSDTIAFSKGVLGKRGLRNSPSVMNVKARDAFFFDGRAKDIFDQIHFPIEDVNEMNVSMSEVVRRLNQSDFYRKIFKDLYKENPNAANIANAIALFEMTLESSETPFDKFMNGNENALNASEQRGREIFLSDEAKCFDCHFGPDFTGDEFKNIGLFDGGFSNDSGRFVVTKNESDLGAFKVPGLRNIGVTGPYMHDGRFKTLEEVVAFYSNIYSVVQNPVNLDSTLVKPLNLTKKEQIDLVNFLKSLTDERFENR